MTRCPFRFVLEVQDSHARVLHRRPLDPDWEPAVQWAHLVGMQMHHGCASETPSSRVEPVWHASGVPVVGGIRIRMTAGALAWSADCPADEYFGDATRAVVAELMAEGVVRAEDRVQLVVNAYTAEAPAPLPAAFSVTEEPPSLTLLERDFAMDASRTVACGQHDDADIRVVVPDVVLDEMVSATNASGDQEVGGVLVGHLCRDPTTWAIGVEVTAQVPARHTVSEAAKLTFTSETWTDVRAAVALRRRGEVLLGWWHSHPADTWCKACPVERQRECQLATGFMSADDRALHRAMFPAAFSQAVVLTRSILGTNATWFGWRRGTLQQRGFRLMSGPIAAVTSPSTGGTHATTVA